MVCVKRTTCVVGVPTLTPLSLKHSLYIFLSFSLCVYILVNLLLFFFKTIINNIT